MSKAGRIAGGRVGICGVRVDAATYEQTLKWCRLAIEGGVPRHHVGVNASKIVDARGDQRYARILDEADFVNPDGQSVVWASTVLGQALPERVTGVDLMADLLSIASEEGYTVYFLGASEEVVRKVAADATANGVRVVGAASGYWDDEDAVVSAIAASNPDMLFLGLPSPMKEFFVDDHLAQLSTRLVMGVGGSFDVLAGKTKRAPVWMQKSGLEWAYRLRQEPRRLLRRYVLGNSHFVALVLRQLAEQKASR